MGVFDMAEYIVEVNQDNSVDLPMDIRDKLSIEPGDKMIMRTDAGHITMGKLPMEADEKGEEISKVFGKRITIEK